MSIPKPKYTVGDEVTVRCDEYPCIPFPAVVSAVWWCRDYGQHEYRVIGDDDVESDGYTEAWLSPRNATAQTPTDSGTKDHE